MAVDHRIPRLAVALVFGLAVAVYAYQRVTDPRPGLQREEEEAAVLAARDILRAHVQPAGDLRIVDPLAPDRKVGKVYVYPADSGWDVSGHYRRGDAERWHPYLMRLDASLSLVLLSVKDDDPRLARKAAADPRISATP
jgi:hypothetical protein